MEGLEDSDTKGLRESEGACRGVSGARGARPRAMLHLNRIKPWNGAVFLAFVLGGCAQESASSKAPAPPSDEVQAQALLDVDTPLAVRAEAVALADRLAIASARAGKTAEGAKLARLAADVRTRLWRFDQSPADGREAVELYAAVAGAVSGSEEGCEADRKRALLVGEMERDAALLYRELYLSARRQAAVLGARSAAETPNRRDDRSACLAAMDKAMAYLSAFRPKDEAMRALEGEGNAAAVLALRIAADGGAPAAPVFSAPVGPPSASPVSSSAAGDVVVAPSRDAVDGGPVKILSVERHGSDKGARVVVHLNRAAAFSVGALSADAAQGKPHRIFVDIEKATARGIPKEIGVGGAVSQVRLGAQENGTRVVLDLSSAMHKRVFYLPNPFRVVIDVSSRPQIQSERLTPDGKREVRRVVLDPGHGGHDAGALGPTGLREKDVTLDIAHRAAPLLAHEFGIDTLLTRDSDAYIPLDLRAARANAFHADLFVSIHCNASEDGQARGVQTFYLDEARNFELAAARVAARENAEQAGKKALNEPIDEHAREEMASVISGLLTASTAERSHHVADLMQRSALASLLARYPDTKDQGVKAAGFYVLAGTDMPAVLLETAFISNPQDEARLTTADFRQKMADAIVNAIRAYRDGK